MEEDAVWRVPCLVLESVESVSRSVVSNSLGSHGLGPTRFLCPWDSPGKNTGVGCHSLLQGIFPAQGSNPGLLHCRQILSLSEPQETEMHGTWHPIKGNLVFISSSQTFPGV